MARVKRGVHARKKHREVLDRAKGYRGARSRRFKVAKEAVQHGERYAYRDRRRKKRDFRRLWIVRINAAARLEGLSYSQLMHGLALAEIEVDRKVLADLAVHDPGTFTKLVNEAKAKLGLPTKELTASEEPAEESAREKPQAAKKPVAKKAAKKPVAKKPEPETEPDSKADPEPEPRPDIDPGPDPGAETE